MDSSHYTKENERNVDDLYRREDNFLSVAAYNTLVIVSDRNT